MESIILFVLVNIYSKHHRSVHTCCLFVYFSSKRNEWVHPILIPFGEKRNKKKKHLSWMSWCSYKLHRACMYVECIRTRSLTLVPCSSLSHCPCPKWHFERQLKCRNRFYWSILSESSINHHNCTSIALSFEISLRNTSSRLFK